MHCRIVDDRLHIGGRPVEFVPSPHRGGRIEPHAIILHDTSDRLDPRDSVRWFADPRSRVSAHFVVGRDGSVVQMVECDRAAWHAGKSSWRGRGECNGWTVGIEIDNPGMLTRKGEIAVAWWRGKDAEWPLDELVELTTPEHGHGWWLPYTPAQIDAVDGIIRALTIVYPTIAEVLGHYHVSPRRKIDPGPHFPMARMQAILAGRRDLPDDAIATAQRRLGDLNFHAGTADGIMGERTRAALRSFQEANRLDITGRLDGATIARLREPDATGAALGAREAASTASVAETSGTMQGAGRIKRSAEVSEAFNIVDALTSSPPAAPAMPVAAPQSAVDALDKLDGALGRVEAAKGVGGRLSGLLDWLMTPHGLKFVIVSAVLLAVWLGAHHIEWRRWRDHITGKHV